MRLVEEGYVAAQDFLTQLVEQERVPLLDGRAVYRPEYRREELGRVHVVHHHRIFPRRGFLLPNLAQDTLQGFRSNPLLHQLVEIQGGFIPVGFRPCLALAPHADAGHQAERRGRRLAFEAVAGYHVLVLLRIVVGRSRRDDALVFPHHLLADLLGKRDLLVRIHLVEVRVHQLQVFASALVVAGSIRQRAGTVFGQIACRRDSVEQELLNLLSVQTVRRVVPTPSLREYLDNQVVFGSLMEPVDFPVPDFNRVAFPVVEDHASCLASVLQREVLRPLRQFLVCFRYHRLFSSNR